MKELDQLVDMVEDAMNESIARRRSTGLWSRLYDTYGCFKKRTYNKQ